MLHNALATFASFKVSYMTVGQHIIGEHIFLALLLWLLCLHLVV